MSWLMVSRAILRETYPVIAGVQLGLVQSPIADDMTVTRYLCMRKLVLRC